MGRIRGCEILHIFTYMMARWVVLGKVRVKECPVGAKNIRKAKIM